MIDICGEREREREREREKEREGEIKYERGGQKNRKRMR